MKRIMVVVVAWAALSCATPTGPEWERVDVCTDSTTSAVPSWTACTDTVGG